MTLPGTAPSLPGRQPDWASAVIEFAGEAVIGTGPDGIITSWNPAAARLFGYSYDEVIGSTILRLSPESHVEGVRAALSRIRAGQPVDHVEAICVRRDGTLIPVSLTVAPIFDECHEVVGISAIVRDVTEHKHAAQYARSLIEAGLDPLVTISPEGRINDVNEATVRITGIPREELIGTDFSAYVTEPDKADEGWQRVFALGSVTDYPLTVRHRDGTLTEVLCNATLYRDAAGTVLGVFAAARDVTLRQKAERALQRMVALVESSNAAIIGESDAIIGATRQGIITGWNPGAGKMFGYSDQEMIGRNLNLLVPKDRAGEAAAIATKVEAGEAIEHCESVRVRRDGTTFPVSLTISPIMDADRSVIGISTIARDLTGQKRDQREIAEWRDRAFKWMEQLEESQRLSVTREFERELMVIDLQREIERLTHPDPPDRGEIGHQAGGEH